MLERARLIELLAPASWCLHVRACRRGLPARVHEEAGRSGEDEAGAAWLRGGCCGSILIRVFDRCLRDEVCGFRDGCGERVDVELKSPMLPVAALATRWRS